MIRLLPPSTNVRARVHVGSLLEILSRSVVIVEPDPPLVIGLPNNHGMRPCARGEIAFLHRYLLEEIPLKSEQTPPGV